MTKSFTSNSIAQALLKHKKISVGEPVEIEIGKETLKFSIDKADKADEDVGKKYSKEFQEIQTRFTSLSEFDISFPLYHDIHVTVHGQWDSDKSFNFENDSDIKKIEIIAYDWSYFDFSSTSDENPCYFIKENLTSKENRDIVFEMLYETNEWKEYAKKVKSNLIEILDLAKKMNMDFLELYEKL